VAVDPTFDFNPENVKYRFGERYTSEASNRKFLGIPLGVYLGFTPSFSDDILTLSAGTDFGYCFARVASQDDPFYILDVIIQADAVLDFTNHASFPVNVILKVNGKLGFPHSAEIVTQTAAPVFPTEILLGVVTAPNTIDVAEPFSRDTPFAYTGAPFGYGFMKDGAVEELIASISINAEVAAARVDLTGFTQPSLGARIEADGAPSAMAERLGKENKTILADDFVIASPTDTINVSRAFSRFHRSITGNTPIQDFDGFASETRTGAITSGTVSDPPPTGALTDPERNVCALIDATTEARLIDSTRQVAYGRLVHNETTLLGTDITFNSASTTVDGSGTFFTTQVEDGDILQDPISGDYFEVASVTSDVLLDLSLPFPNATTPPATPPGLRRRFTLNARTRSGPDSDALFNMPTGTVRVFFNAWLSVEIAQFDYMASLQRNFEESPVATATTALAGKALVTSGLSEGKAGAIFAVQQIGVQVGAPHVDTINFNGATSGGAGIANVTQRGPAGIPGNPGGGGPGVPGPTGAQGPQGQGFTNFSSANLFRESPVFINSLLGSGTQYTFTQTMSGSEILFLTGGNSEWYSPFVFDADDHFQIDNIEILAGMQVRLSARVPIGGSPAAELRFFLNAATR
jgi:hypothetical protein